VTHFPITHSWQLLGVFLACDVEIASVEILLRDGREPSNSQLLSVALINLLEAPLHDEVHTIEELVGLGHDARADDLAEEVHLVAHEGGVNGGVAHYHAADEESAEVAELGDFVGASVSLSDVLEHDASVHGGI